MRHLHTPSYCRKGQGSAAAAAEAAGLGTSNAPLSMGKLASAAGQSCIMNGPSRGHATHRMRPLRRQRGRWMAAALRCRCARARALRPSSAAWVTPHAAARNQPATVATMQQHRGRGTNVSAARQTLWHACMMHGPQLADLIHKAPAPAPPLPPSSPTLLAPPYLPTLLCPQAVAAQDTFTLCMASAQHIPGGPIAADCASLTRAFQAAGEGMCGRGCVEGGVRGGLRCVCVGGAHGTPTQLP